MELPCSQITLPFFQMELSSSKMIWPIFFTLFANDVNYFSNGFTLFSNDVTYFSNKITSLSTFQKSATFAFMIAGKSHHILHNLQPLTFQRWVKSSFVIAVRSLLTITLIPILPFLNNLKSPLTGSQSGQ